MIFGQMGNTESPCSPLPQLAVQHAEVQALPIAWLDAQADGSALREALEKVEAQWWDSLHRDSLRSQLPMPLVAALVLVTGTLWWSLFITHVTIAVEKTALLAL